MNTYVIMMNTSGKSESIAEMSKRLKRWFQNPLNCIAAGLSATLFIMNSLTVPTSDDLGYSISNGIADIFRREYHQYMTWTGRSVAHIIARSFLAMPKIIFNVCNSLCFVYLCWLIYCHATGSRKKDRPILFALIAVLVFLCVPFFGQTVLWETGSCNYLWTTSIILSFFLPYRDYLESGKETHSKLFWLIMIPAGIIAGWTNENTGGALILIIILFLIILLKKHQKLPAWMFSGLIGSIAGFAVMIMAPGNKVRAADFANTNGKAYELVHDLTDTMSVLDHFGALLPLLLAIAAILALLFSEKKRREPCILSLCYAVAGLAAVFAIILTPVQVLFDRSMFGATVFIIISLSILLNQLVLAEHTAVLKSALSCLILISSCQYVRAVADLGYTKYQYDARETYVQEQKAAGNLNPVVPQIYREFETSYNPLHGLNDITEYPKYWVNQSYEEVHGLEGVQSTPLDQWKRIYAQGDPYLMNIQDMKEYIAAIASDRNYAVLINCSTLKGDYSSYTALLTSFGLKIDQETNFIAVYENGALVLSKTAAEGIDGSADIDGSYAYLSSYQEGSMSDIMIGNLEYTNDNSGISIVVYSLSDHRVVDSVTWNTDNGMTGIRYKLEK